MIGMLAIVISIGISPTLGNSDTKQQIWEVSNSYQQKKMIFDYSDSTLGNISSVEVTPQGRSVSPYHSHVSNINQGKMKFQERTSALQGSYKSENSIKFESEIADIADYYFYNPFYKLHLKSTITISSWNATQNIRYSGKEINDRDYAFNDFDQYGKDTNAVSFLHNKNFSKDRTFRSPGEFSIRAETTGLSQLKFNHNMKDESDLIKDEMYFGKFNISMNNSHKFGFVGTYTYHPTCNDWLDGICEIPCWDQDYYNIIWINPTGSLAFGQP